MKQVLSVLIAALAVASGVPAQAKSPQCAELVRYRDTRLLADYDTAARQQTAANRSLEVLKGVKAEAQKLRAKQPTVNDAYQLTLSLRTAANTVASILRLDPATGALLGTAKTAGGWAGKVLKASEVTSFAAALTENSLAEHLLTEAVADASMLGAALAGAYALAKEIAEQKDAYGDGQQILAMLDDNLKRLEGQVARVDNKLKAASFRLESVNRVRANIDTLCR